jgi:ubiquinone/menaquinone biosynthesis C-methylase UbiE
VAPRSTYVFDNAGAQAGARFSALGALFDPGTTRHLTALGVAEGWHCLEVGAGAGSIADWLCDRVGAADVVATDIDPRFLDAAGRPNLEVRRHDIASDPLSEAAFDLVHARLVLVHLPERENALLRIVRALKPGAGCSSRSSTRCRCVPIRRSIPTRCCSRPTMRCSG